MDRMMILPPHRLEYAAAPYADAHQARAALCGAAMSCQAWDPRTMSSGRVQQCLYCQDVHTLRRRPSSLCFAGKAGAR